MQLTFAKLQNQKLDKNPRSSAQGLRGSRHSLQHVGTGQRSIHILGFLTWLRPLLWVLTFSVVDGEASTGGPVAGDLPSHSRLIFFPPDLLASFWFLPFLRLSLQSSKFQNLLLSIINKGKGIFVIFPTGWSERSWTKIFDTLTEIVNLAFLGATGALRRPLHQVTLASTFASLSTFRFLSKVWFHW
ncbi:hypothetical protein Cgig2_019878 [Carnegiea gigantea]|uniref:Uncharacterized protein n=1 Tax=Carnegiea gigantea TaxID=171969 RepID=A0A9Q1KIQ6_9CARY|nr:hypothetical protein Cgig2_019878 [Carnegiea gigantea]